METKNKKFKDVFGKIPLPRATMNEFAMADVHKIAVYKNSRSMVIRLIHNRIIKESHIRALQQEIRAQMPYLEHVNVKIRYKLQEMDMEKAIRRYWENMLYSVSMLSPVCHTMLETADWAFSEGELRVRLKNSSLLLFLQKGIDKELQRLLDEGLGDVKVVFEATQPEERGVFPSSGGVPEGRGGFKHYPDISKPFIQQHLQLFIDTFLHKQQEATVFQSYTQLTLAKRPIGGLKHHMTYRA